MPFKFDFLDGDVIEWETGADGADHRRVADYTPTIYVGVRGENHRALDQLEGELRDDLKTVSVTREQWFKDLRSDERSTVLRVDLERVHEIDTIAREIRALREAPRYAPGSFQLYNVDFSEEFRYCLETRTDPTPSTELSLLELSITDKPLADRDLTALRLDREPVANTPRAVLQGLVDELERRDPDVLLVSTAQIVPLLYDAAEERGLIPDVLEPIVEDRDEIKAAIREADDPEQLAALEERSDALKWILVTCFGYQGYKNSKFGRIEAHEAINAYAREILLQTKEVFEAGGWGVVHGIVDSIWVRAMPDREQRSLDAVAAEISEQVGIRLEYEAEYDWICFVPKRGQENAGALTKYFGKQSETGEYKVRGIEIRQRSTPAFIESVQREFLDVLDEYREPEPVCDRLEEHLEQLREGEVDPAELVFRKRASKGLDAYDQGTHVVSALHRYEEAGIEKGPGQDVEYIVVDDGAKLPHRVRLPFEEIEVYDVGVYSQELVRAAESIVSPLGWEREDIRRYLRETTDATLLAYE